MLSQICEKLIQPIEKSTSTAYSEPSPQIRTDQAPTHPAELQTPKNNCGAALTPPPTINRLLDR